MKIIFSLSVIFLFNCCIVFGQIPRSLNYEEHKTETGFIYFIDKTSLPVSFVSLKNITNKDSLSFNDFCSQNIKEAYQFGMHSSPVLKSWLKNDAYKYKVYHHYYHDTSIVFLYLIPVKMTYTIYSYKISKESLFPERYKFKNKVVKFDSMLGVPIKIDSLQTMTFGKKIILTYDTIKYYSQPPTIK